MDFEKTFPLRYWINLGRRTDRRGEMEWKLQEAGVTAERFPAVDARFVRHMALERTKNLKNKELVRGYENAGRYALALTQRMAIRRAKLKGVDAVLLLEDDCILHPNFLALVKNLHLPEDWGIFYFGCAPFGRPEPAAPGIVRVRHALDTHAVAIRAPWYDRVITALDAHNKPLPSHPLASDRFLAALHEDIPTYSCFPHLAWQAVDESDLVGKNYSLYRAGGTPKAVPWWDVFREMYGGEFSRPKIALLFLTRGDVKHPQIWREFIADAPDRAKIFSHSKYPEQAEEGFLKGTQISERHDTAWGSISLVKATLSLLRTALEDPTISHFVLLSESCVPVKPLREIFRHLKASPGPRFWFQTVEKASDLQKNRAAHLPQLPPGCWRFQGQWWMLDRIAANWVARADYTDIFEGMPIPDEAYFSTVLSLMGYPIDDAVNSKATTWTKWEGDGGSPTQFERVPEEIITEIVESGAWFARKFAEGSDIGRFMLHTQDH